MQIILNIGDTTSLSSNAQEAAMTTSTQNYELTTYSIDSVEQRILGWFMFNERHIPVNATTFISKLRLQSGHQYDLFTLRYLVDELTAKLNKVMFNSRRPLRERLIGIAALHPESEAHIELMLRAPVIVGKESLDFSKLLLDTWTSLGFPDARNFPAPTNLPSEQAFRHFMKNIESRESVEKLYAFS